MSLRPDLPDSEAVEQANREPQSTTTKLSSAPLSLRPDFPDGEAVEKENREPQSTSNSASELKVFHPDPTLEEITSWYDALYEQAGICHIQFGGGEPTLRDDLPQIIELGKRKGFEYFQLNTNGIKLGENLKLSIELKKAGLSCVFLQFDGLSDSTHETLRGKNLLEIKQSAIKNCEAAKLPVVLVPTVSKGVNDKELMSIINFAIANSPTVRGVHFQPISFFGRNKLKEAARISFSELIELLEEQSASMIKSCHFSGGCAEHESCSINANYLINDEGKLEYFGAKKSCCNNDDTPSQSKYDPVSKAQDVQKRRWAPSLEEIPCCESQKGSMDEFLWKSIARGFSITGMAFMDEETLDLERLKKCYIFTMNKDKKLIPFCAYNLTIKGKSYYRK
jgi:uncharacterized radical SAM superfamily Fe-S cluster-containing enzyme